MSMPELSAADAARARKIEAAILNRLASVGQARIAEQLGVDESTVSRWKNGEIARFSRFLALLGLKATPQEYKCYDEKTLEAMLTLAQQRMSQIRGVDHLAFEDDE
ncbi:hypothetical protein CAL14_08380 [Bordetella genomosp. 9]|nr:hypothetical protein CAL14_08380 [Bordetella genomosp. 9]